MKVNIRLAVVVLAALIPLLSQAAQQIDVPASFNWSQIPPYYKGKILIIKHHHKTNNIDIKLPENAVVIFKKGSISGFKSLLATSNKIIADKIKIFEPYSTITGTFKDTEGRPEWFGAKGDGLANDGAAVEAAIKAFQTVKFSKKYYIPKLKIAITKPLTMIGEKGATIKGDNSNEGFFDVRNSVNVKNLSFEKFRFCFYFNQNGKINGVNFNGCTFSDIEKAIFAPINNTIQFITNVNITKNKFERCYAGIELFAKLTNVEVKNNSFMKLGDGKTQKQANAIRLGNTAHNYKSDKLLGNYKISGNSIKDVFCGQNFNGDEGFECHGIFALGNKIVINNNTIENVYNGGVRSSPRIKTGSEGIYVKANDCQIIGNTLINAGFGEGSIAVKDFNKGVTISKNTIRHTKNIADYAQLITAYFSEELVITENLLESSSSSCIAMKLCGPKDSPVKAIVTGNSVKISDGFGFKIMNMATGGLFEIVNNDFTVKGNFLTEESKKPYNIEFKGNSVKSIDGVFLLSSNMNKLNYSNNSVEVLGETKTTSVPGEIELVNNTITIQSSANKPFIIFYEKSTIVGNQFLLNGAWRFLLTFNGNQPATISSNTFTSKNARNVSGKILYINHPIASLSYTISENKYIALNAGAKTIFVSVANKGLETLNLNGNEMKAKDGFMLEVLAPIKRGSFSMNITDKQLPFASEASMKKIEKYVSVGNTKLNDTK